jgi:hypothetical protein
MFQYKYALISLWPVMEHVSFFFTRKQMHYCSEYMLTYSMVQGPWEANWFAASQEILRIYIYI